MSENYRKPGPIYVRPLNEEEKEYFRKRHEQLKKSQKVKKKVHGNWAWKHPQGDGSL